MKYLKLLSFVLFSLVSNGQSDTLFEIFPAVNGKINFTEVVPVDSATKDQLYTRVKLFLADAYKSSKDVIQVDDKDAGIMKVKAFSKVPLTLMGITSYIDVWHTLTISIKDNKIKYELTDLICKGYNKDAGGFWESPYEQYAKGGKARERFRNDTYQDLTALISNLKKSVNNPAKSDW